VLSIALYKRNLKINYHNYSFVQILLEKYILKNLVFFL